MKLILAAGLACLAAACKDKTTDATERAPIRATASQQGTSGGIAPFDGDAYDDLFAGAPFASADDGTLGAVLVYRGTAAGFDETPTWTLTGGDSFGATFATVGDVDGDGRADYAVGAINADGAEASLSGTVTVYRGGSSGQVLRTLGGEQALDRFGSSITGGCDLNADGHVDLVVGAPTHSPAPDRYLGGAYYVYFGPQLADAARVKLAATADTGILGFSSACGDVNGDGVDDLVTSAIWTHGVIWHASKVLVHYGAAGFAPATDAADVTIDSTASHFGDALAVLDDLDGDGFREVVIGVPALYAIPAPSATNPMPSLKGRVYVVKGGTGTRRVNLSPAPGTPIPELVATITGVDYLERFGATLATLGDLDGDRKPDLAVGAPHANAAGATSLATGWVTGAVYVFLGKDVATNGTGTSAATAARRTSGAGRTLHYGSFLAPFERGGPKLAVGVPGANRQSGSVVVQDLTPAAP